jgi:hypothetical protein
LRKASLGIALAEIAVYPAPSEVDAAFIEKAVLVFAMPTGAN